MVKKKWAEKSLCDPVELFKPGNAIYIESQLLFAVKGTIIKNKVSWAVVAHAFYPSTWEAEAGGSL